MKMTTRLEAMVIMQQALQLLQTITYNKTQCFASDLTDAKDNLQYGIDEISNFEHAESSLIFQENQVADNPLFLPVNKGEWLAFTDYNEALAASENTNLFEDMEEQIAQYLVVKESGFVVVFLKDGNFFTIFCNDSKTGTFEEVVAFLNEQI
jgi:hypothetical protein